MKLIHDYNLNLSSEMKKNDREALVLISKLDGYIENSIFKNAYIFVNMLKEILNSNEIENIHTTYMDLLDASIDLKNIDTETKSVFYNKEAIHKGDDYIKSNGFLDKKIFIKIQKIIRKTNDEFRKLPGVRIINSKKEVVYIPPQKYEEIIYYMNDLEKYINDLETDNKHGLIIKMAIIHFQFEAIHPFNDGNGRIGRIINLLFFILKKVTLNPIFSLSYFIANSKDQYYEKLNQIHNDDAKINNFITYMIEGVKQSAHDGVKLLKNIETIYNETFYKIRNILKKINENDFLLLFNRLIFDNNNFSKILKISRNTSLKYLNILKHEKIILQLNSKSKYYIFKDIIKIFE